MKFRLLFAVLGCFGMAIIYGFKVNLSVAIVAMVNKTTLKELSKGIHTTSNASIDALTCSRDLEEKIHTEEEVCGI